MDWNYNSVPGTHRTVLVAFRAPELLETNHVHYVITSLDLRGEAFVLPDSYEVIAWADFERIEEDGERKPVTHHWLHVEGLK